jgi:integrase
MYLASLRTDVSRRGQISALNHVAAIILSCIGGDPRLWQQVNWCTLSAPAVRAIMARLPGAPATRNKALAALRGVARAGWDAGEIDTDTYQRICGVRGDGGVRLPRGRYVEPGEISAMMEACGADRSAAGRRDAAMLALMVATGMRRCEIISMDMSRIDPGLGCLRIIGKRDKERTSYIANEARSALRAWLRIRGVAPGPVFCRMRRGGVVCVGEALATISVNRVLAKRAGQAGVKGITPHDLRRTFISNALDQADIATVAAVVGHADLRTTQLYDRRGDVAKRRLAERIRVPTQPCQ